MGKTIFQRLQDYYSQIARIINTITDHPVIKEQTRALVQLVKQRQIEPLYPVLKRWWSN